MSLTKLFAGIIFVMSLSGCAVAQYTDLQNRPVTPLRMTVPPAIYKAWWNEIAECEGVPAPPEFDSVVWVIIPANRFKVAGDTTHYEAITFTPQPRIFVNQEGLFDRGLIQHEEMHAILFFLYGNKYVGRHPMPYYKQCGLVPVNQQKL